MNRIVHLALKVDDLERTTEFYQKVFGFKEMNTEKVRDHTSRHLSDGVLDVALIKYDAGTQSAESRASGEGPCIHHFAVEVDSVDAATKQITSYGCEIISDPGVIPVKFRAPGGTVCELVPKGRYKKPIAAKKKPAQKAAKKAAKKKAKTRRCRRTTPASGRALRSSPSRPASSSRPRAGITADPTAPARDSSRSGMAS